MNNTPSNANLRRVAQKIMQAALTAVDPAAAVKNYFKANPQVTAQIKSTPGQIYVVGAGKAGAPMAQAAAEIFGPKISAGHVIVKYGHTGKNQPQGIKISKAAHPVPDKAGFQATQEIIGLLNQTTAEDVVLCLISGGGSALLTCPAQGLTLKHLQATTEGLLAAGSTINQVNTVRKHLSAIKGGRLAEQANPAKIFTLILSDAVGDPLEVIASGPTVADPSTFSDAWAIVEQFQLQEKLPEPVIKQLQDGCAGQIADTPKPADPIFERVENIIIGSNRIAARAAVDAAQAAGFNAQLLSTFIEGEAREVGRVVAGLAKGLIQNEAALPRPACLVMGGETTVTLKGNGQGGRNQEMALSAAIALAGWPDALVVCLGTDGNDGPTDAAGALADGFTLRRAEAAGLSAIDFLNRNDAYNFFKALDDLIITGPTNTNVNDLTLVLVN